MFTPFLDGFSVVFRRQAGVLRDSVEEHDLLGLKDQVVPGGRNAPKIGGISLSLGATVCPVHATKGIGLEREDEPRAITPLKAMGRTASALPYAVTFLRWLLIWVPQVGLVQLNGTLPLDLEAAPGCGFPLGVNHPGNPRDSAS